MDGFYSVCTDPFYANPGNKGKQFSMHDYELLTIILSVCVYQKYNGPCRIYLDDISEKYFSELNITKLFEKGSKKFFVDKEINPSIFWAAGKLFALREEEKPSVMIDLDLIIWKNLEEFFKAADIYGIHREEIRNEIYPDPYLFKVKEGYKLPADLSLNELPMNTAMLYIADDDFRLEYTNKSIEFMKNCTEQYDNLKPMVFAEQRYLTMLGEKNHKITKTMFQLGQDIGYQEYFTHIWGHKNILKYNYDERRNFIKRIMKRLENEYPEGYEIALPIVNMDMLK